MSGTTTRGRTSCLRGARAPSAREPGEEAPRRGGAAAFTLVEVLVALSLVASVGVAASALALTLGTLVRRAGTEAAALAATSAKVEELLALPPERRGDGFDEIERSGIRLTRLWRVVPDDPEPGLARIEVTARWQDPDMTLLTLVAVAP